MPTESHIKQQVMRFLAAVYPTAVVRKRHGTVYSTGGDPDLLILFNGVHVECELKQPGASPTLLQLSRLRKWAAAGARTCVVHSVEEMRAFMESTFGPPAPLKPARSACIGNDPLCPCQEGDMCHYRGPNAWPVPPKSRSLNRNVPIRPPIARAAPPTAPVAAPVEDYQPHWPFK